MMVGFLFFHQIEKGLWWHRPWRNFISKETDCFGFETSCSHWLSSKLSQWRMQKPAGVRALPVAGV